MSSNEFKSATVKKARMAFVFLIHKTSQWWRRFCLHLCILIGSVSIMLEKVPSLLNPTQEPALIQTETSDQLLAQAISATQKRPSVLKPKTQVPQAKAPADDSAKGEIGSVDRFDQLFDRPFSARTKQLLNAFATDKLALWSVFSNLSTYSGLLEILNQPIRAFERETLRSQSFGIASGFDQIIYRIHLESGGTSLIVAQVEEDAVKVSLYRAPDDSSKPYSVHRFKDGMWVDSSEVVVAQVEQEVLKTKSQSAVVLSASVGL